MAEKLRFEGTPVVLLLLFGESFRTAMDRTIVQKKLHYFDKYHRRSAAAGLTSKVVRDFAVPSRG